MQWREEGEEKLTVVISMDASQNIGTFQIQNVKKVKMMDVDLNIKANNLQNGGTLERFPLRS